jgi:hypothetical protein
MNNTCLKYDPRQQKPKRMTQWILSRLVISLVGVAALPLVPCSGQADASGAANDLQRILDEKDTAVARADQQYANSIDTVEKSYEKSLLQARTAWSDKIAITESTAVTALKTLSSRLAAAGRLADTVEVLKAVYALSPQDRESAKALVGAGVDIKVIQPELDYATRGDAKQTTKIVLWNTHNSRFNTSGTLQCNVVLFHLGLPVWRANKVDLPWKQSEDTFSTVDVPPMRFDIVRVEIVKWRGYSGGLAEIEVWRDGKNVALHQQTRASGAADRLTLAARATDGVTSSNSYKDGYWLLPDNQAGWIEISLAKPAYQELVRTKVSARTRWQQVLKVSAGDIVDITASGEWRASPQIPAGPDGGIGPGEDQWGRFSDRFFLQGRLNDEVFRVGSRFTLRVAKAGELELGMNEGDIDWFLNNSGFLNVSLSIRRRSPSRNINKIVL